MPRYTVSADSLEELAEALAEITGGEAPANAAAGAEAPKRTRKKRSEAPDPVTPTSAPDTTAAAAAPFNPGAAAAGPAESAPFNPGAAAAAPGPGAFNPGAAAGPSETFTKVKAHLEAMAGQHGVANVYNWVNQVLGAAGAQGATPEHIRDNVLPTLTDAQLVDIYTKAGGK